MTEREALKLALEALESCGAGHITDGGNQWHDEKLVDKAIKALEAALEAHKALANHCEDNLNMVKQEQGEPVAESVEKLKELGWNDAAIDKANTPQQRTWVGLTDEEIKKIAKKHRWHESNVSPHLMPVFRSLEAKLKEKNNG